jgi:hypothetical protein
MAPETAKLPRAVRKGPLITLNCECGQDRALRYGERWRCEGCGRTWDTNKIPLEEYAAIRRRQVRHRLVPLIGGLILLAAVVLFIVKGRAYGALIVIPFLLTSWNIFVRPFFRRRYRSELIDKLPTWKIEPE